MFNVEFDPVQLDNNEILPVTVVNYSGFSENRFIDITKSSVIVESLLFFFDDDNDVKLGDYIPAVDMVDHNIFTTLKSDPLAFVIDDDRDLLRSNINVVTPKQFRLMSLLKRYMGAFMPVIINSVSMLPNFIPSDNGMPSAELYTTHIN